jgi:putative phosphonate metabolism protein
MDEPSRYAIYYAPPEGDFADATASWLGWDAGTGRAVAHPDVPGLPGPVAALTGEPRKYGFHGTLMAPFRLDDGHDTDNLHDGIATLAARLRPVVLPGLRLAAIDGFLALIPDGETAPLDHLAAEVVRTLAPFRAALTPDDIARRRPDRLTPRQREYLARWGYPYVMEEFRFHLTLTGNIGTDAAGEVAMALAPWLAPVLPRPFRVADLCLFGEMPDGRFRILHRYPLSG